MEKIHTTAAPAAIGPYSQAIKANGFVFTSGQIALDPATGAVAEGGIAEQTHRICQNLKAVLEAAGSSLSDVVKTVCFLADMNDFAAVNKIYGTYFTSNYPARTCIEIARLPMDALIEIEAIGYAD